MPIRFRLSKTQSQVLHYFLTGLAASVGASLTGIVSSSVISLATLAHVGEVALIAAAAGTLTRFAGPQSSTGAPGTTPAAPTT